MTRNSLWTYLNSVCILMILMIDGVWRQKNEHFCGCWKTLLFRAHCSYTTSKMKHWQLSNTEMRFFNCEIFCWGHGRILCFNIISTPDLASRTGTLRERLLRKWNGLWSQQTLFFSNMAIYKVYKGFCYIEYLSTFEVEFVLYNSINQKTTLGVQVEFAFLYSNI